MKIMLVIPTLAKGGAERVVSTLSNHFDSNNIEVVIAVFNYRGTTAYPLNKGVRLVYLTKTYRTPNIFNRIWMTTLTFFRFFTLILKEKPDCVMSFLTTANLWTGFMCNLIGIPYTVS